MLELDCLQLSYGDWLRVTHLPKNPGRNPWVSKAQRSANFIVVSDSEGKESPVQEFRRLGDYETAIAVSRIKLLDADPVHYAEFLAACEQAGTAVALYGPNSFHTVFVPDDVDLSRYRTDDDSGSDWLREIVERGQRCDAVVFYRGDSEQPHVSVAGWQAPAGVAVLHLASNSLQGLYLGKLHTRATNSSGGSLTLSRTRSKSASPSTSTSRSAGASGGEGILEYSGSEDAHFAVVADKGLWGLVLPLEGQDAEFD